MNGSDCNRADLTQLGPISAADVDWLRDDVLPPLNRTISNVSSFR
ncbi:hypothetical protein [Streptomyces lancefieldiae]|uniref:Uncharacterized protein n=1 Tax=Streptomyces lancefieldiae TaxID=3075520 RepID=A0ABU3AN94_9ACTN|nr:hypothetical protein [Streptomyces sp. DSM 40712]MDT0611027.1 hypothetical protein [Streptomyces sp. DSM 40712]